MTRAGVQVGLTGLVVVAVLAVVLWPDAGPADELAAPAVVAPAGSVADAPLEPLAGRAAPAGAEALVDADLAAADTAAEAAVESAEGGEPPLKPLGIRGRLVDVRGDPIAGALVRVHPSGAARRRAGNNVSYFMEGVPWGDFPGQRTDEDGRFDVRVEEVAERDGTRTTAEHIERSTVLVATHPGFRPRGVIVAGREWDVDLGDIELQPGAVVRGRVVDALGAPLEGARILVPRMARRDGPGSDDEWGLLRELMQATSGVDGRFRLDTQWPGDYRFEIAKAGHEPWREMVHVPADEPVDLGDVVLTDGHVLSGRVFDAAGAPLPGVELKLRPTSLGSGWDGQDTVLRDLRIVTRSSSGAQEQLAVTDEHGRFRVDDLPADTTYDVLVWKDGHEPRGVRGQAVDSELEFVLPPEALLVLTFVDEASGEPLEGARGSVRRCSQHVDGNMSDMDAHLEVLTGREAAERLGRDDEGVGLLVAGPAGPLRHELKARAPGRAPRTLELPGLQPGERLEREVRLAAGGSVHGRVLDADGLPVLGADVIARSPREGEQEWDWPKAEAVSDAGGAFELENLAAGSWRLGASARGRVDSPPFELVLDVGQRRGDVELRVGAAALIEGVLLDPDGLPAAAVHVLARLVTESEEGGVQEKAVSDSEGAFRIESLAAGPVELRAHPGARLEVETSAAEVTKVTLRQRRLPVVRGRVVDAAGQPVRAEVKAFVDESRWFDARVTADARGEFLFDDLSPGEVVFVAQRDGLRGPPVTRRLDWGDQLVVDLRLGGARLVGRVLHAETDAPLAGVGVHVYRAGSNSGAQGVGPGRATVTSDADGAFALDGLLPGPWTLTVDDFEWVTLDVEPEPVELLEGAEVARDLVLLPSAELRGRVSVLGDLSGVKQLSMRLEPLDGQGPPWSAGVPTDGGEYVARGLRTGRYRYEVRHNHHVPPLPDQLHVFAAGEVEVVQGQTVRHDLVLVCADG